MSRLYSDFLQAIEKQNQNEEFIDDAVIREYLQFEIKFGKYKGDTYDEILKKDYHYFKWVVANQEEFSPRLHRVFSYLIEEIQKHQNLKKENARQKHGSSKSTKASRKIRPTTCTDSPQEEENPTLSTPDEMETIPARDSKARKKMDRVIPEYNHDVTSPAKTPTRLAESSISIGRESKSRKKRKTVTSSRQSDEKMGESEETDETGR